MKRLSEGCHKLEKGFVQRTYQEIPACILPAGIFSKNLHLHFFEFIPLISAILLSQTRGAHKSSPDHLTHQRRYLIMLTLTAIITGAQLGGMLGGAIATIAGVSETAAAVFAAAGTAAGAATGLAVGAAESGLGSSASGKNA